MQQPHRSAFPILLAGLSGGAGLGIYVNTPRFRGLTGYTAKAFKKPSRPVRLRKKEKDA